MLYCSDCMTLTEGDICQECQNRDLRPPLENDPVRLITQKAMFAPIIEDILKQKNIPCLMIGQLGAGLTTSIGYLNEIFRIFVPYGALAAAQELVGNFEDEEYLLKL